MQAITLRLPDELMAKVQEEAKKEHRTVSGQIRHLMELGQEAEEKGRAK